MRSLPKLCNLYHSYVILTEASRNMTELFATPGRVYCNCKGEDCLCSRITSDDAMHPTLLRMIE